MFGFAREHLRDHLGATWASEATQHVVAELRTLAEQERAAGASDVPVLAGPDASTGQFPPSAAALVTQFVHQLMARDSKATALKTLQGHIWKAGFESGALKGEFYPDVIPCLESWTRRQYRVYIYSSGSIAAQQLLFGHPHGRASLLPLLAGHFDTTSGPKRESASYAKIAAAIGVPPEHVLFLTDIWEEAHAADAAGMRTFWETVARVCVSCTCLCA